MFDRTGHIVEVRRVPVHEDEGVFHVRRENQIASVLVVARDEEEAIDLARERGDAFKGEPREALSARRMSFVREMLVAGNRR